MELVVDKYAGQNIVDRHVSVDAGALLSAA